MLLKEASVVLENLIQIMAEKMEEPISHAHGWINGWITIRILILYSCMILGARITITSQDREPDLKLGSVLLLGQ